jgi:hypothetical protein
MRLSFAGRLSLLVVPLTLGLVSCGDSAGTTHEREGQVRQELFANDKTIYDYFVGKGLTGFQAAGIAGNLDQESGGNPMAVQPGGPGRGIAQWSVGGRWDKDANDNATAFAASKGQSVWSLQLQLDFVWYELTNFSGYGLAALKATTNVTDATVVFQNKFEGCGTCIETQRVAYAKAVLAAYGNTAPPEYAAKFVSQTYPYASVGPVKLQVGQTVTGSIVMQNVGSQPWKAGVTKLAPIPRDQASPFQAGNWLTNARVSSVAQDVAPGANGTFQWDLKGSTPGDFSPFFGFVEDGVTWFADAPKGGGPLDDVVQLHIVVTPAAGTGGAGGSGAGGSGKAGAGGSSTAGAGGSGKAGSGAGGTSAQGTGGMTSAGGSGASAGAPGVGGGTSAAGGAGPHAGAGSVGGNNTSAGGSGLGGGDSAAGSSGVSVVPAADEQSTGGCAVTAQRGASAWSLAGLAPILALALRRRRSKRDS